MANIDNVDQDNNIYAGQNRVEIKVNATDVVHTSTIKTVKIGGITVAFTTWGQTIYIDIGYGQSNNFGWKTVDLNPNDTVNQDPSAIRMMNAAKTALVAATGQIPSDTTPDAGDSDCMVDFANYANAWTGANETAPISTVLVLGGQGASSVTEIADGTTPFTNLKSDVTKIYDFLIAEGFRVHIRNVLYLQGEKNVNTSTEAGWATAVATTIYDPLETFILGLTGQIVSPVMQIAVLSMHSNYTGLGQNFNQLAIEQLLLPAMRPGKIKATVFTGHMTHSDDGVHWAGDAQRYARQMQAKYSIYRDLEPLLVDTANRVGATIELLVKGGEGDLKFDYTLHASTTSKGFRVFNTSSVAVTITSVTLDVPNRKVIVTLADGGSAGPYTIDGSYFSSNSLGGGQYHQNIMPITDSDPRAGTLSDSTDRGNKPLTNPLMPINMSVGGS